MCVCNETLLTHVFCPTYRLVPFDFYRESTAPAGSEPGGPDGPCTHRPLVDAIHGLVQLISKISAPNASLPARSENCVTGKMCDAAAEGHASGCVNIHCSCRGWSFSIASPPMNWIR